MPVNMPADSAPGSPRAALETQESQRRLAMLKRQLLQEIDDALDRLLADDAARQHEASAEAEALVRHLLSAVEAGRATRPADTEVGDAPFVVRPWPYLRAMFNIAKGAFLHPWRTTVVDLETGAVVN